MHHDADREAGAVRVLLAVATGDSPPGTDLLEKVCRRVRRQRVRRRVLVPSLATLAAASLFTVAMLVSSVVTGTPSAQARVAAAAERTAAEGYRVRIARATGDRAPGSSPAPWVVEGVFNPAQRTGRLLILGRHEVRIVGDTVYSELPAEARRNGKRWLAEPPVAHPERIRHASERLPYLFFRDPRQALAGLRSATAVREQGRIAGDGWSGRRYVFEFPDGRNLEAGARATGLKFPPEGETRTTGAVDVDQSGRVRRLEVIDRVTTGVGSATRTLTLRTVLEFRDYGAHETVSAPPAHQVVSDPPPAGP